MWAKSLDLVSPIPCGNDHWIHVIKKLHAVFEVCLEEPTGWPGGMRWEGIMARGVISTVTLTTDTFMPTYPWGVFQSKTKTQHI